MLTLAFMETSRSGTVMATAMNLNRPSVLASAGPRAADLPMSA